jgi:hypothetical protein
MEGFVTEGICLPLATVIGSDRLIKQKQADDILSLLALQWASSLVFQSSIFLKTKNLRNPTAWKWSASDPRHVMTITRRLKDVLWRNLAVF